MIFNYETRDELSKDEELTFYKDHFLIIVDQAIVFINIRCTELKTYSYQFEFLYRIGKIQFTDEHQLKKLFS